MSRLRMAVIGVGHLGKEHARILAGLPDVELVGVVDANEEQAKAVALKHNTQAYTKPWPLLGAVDAACVVVPTTFHAETAGEFLRRGTPLLIEKPLAGTLKEAEQIVELARRNQTIVQVGHIERFNPAFEEIMGRPLQPKLVRCHRAGPFTGRSADVGVILDLMIHDLDLLLALVKWPVRSVEAAGISVFGGHEDIASARLHFANGCVAEVFASRASPTPARTMQVWAPEGYAEIDFAQRRVTLVQPTDQVRRHGLDPARLDAASRGRIREELFTRYLPTQTIEGKARDQLTAELTHFIHCVRTGETPRVSGEAGRDAIALADRILLTTRRHRWDGATDSHAGPHHLPSPLGQLFPMDADRQAA